MNARRFILAVIVATLVDLLYGFVAYGTLLEREVAINNAVYRTIDGVNANLPWLIGGLLLTMATAVYLYAHGAVRSGSGLVSGLKFGVAVGLFCVGYVAIGNFVVMKLGKRLTVYMAAAELLEWVVVGIAIGLVYLPARTTDAGAGR